MSTVKRSRCKKCGELFIRAVDPNTGFKRLFVARRLPDRTRVADLTQPHVNCAGSVGDQSKIRQIVRDEVQAIQRENPTWIPKPGGDVTMQATSATISPETIARMETRLRDIAAGVQSQPMTEQTVQLIGSEVRRQLAALPPREIVVKLARPEGEETTLEGTHHPLFPRLLRYVAAGLHVYLYGAPGGGKSTAAKQCAAALGRRYGYLSLAPMTPESRLMGFIDANGTYRQTPFYECFKDGGIFCLDEADNANDALLTSMNGALENGVAAFPCGIVERHPDFTMVATGNTAGYGGTRGHASRRPFDAATRERFAYIPWTYDDAFEEKLTLAAHASAGAWLAWVRQVRSYCKTNHPDVVVSPRASIRGAELLKAGSVESLPELAEAVLFKGLEAEQQRRILSACPLPMQVN